MKIRTIHAKQLDSLTSVLFSYKDVSIMQENALVVLDKEQILELARIIQNEKYDQEFYENLRKERIINGQSYSK
jgi:hypothetical protein